MHAEALGWVRLAVHAHGRMLRRVLEVGSRDVNGSPRSLVGWHPLVAPTDCDWVGIDAIPGRGVDWVGLAHEYPARGWDGRPFDALVSCEQLEHDPWPTATIGALAPLVLQGGLVVVTCASPARSPHGLEEDTPRPGHYRGVSPHELDGILVQAGVVVEACKLDRGGLDTWAWGTRGADRPAAR